MLGAIILGIGNTMQALMGASYLVSAYRSFPHHLLSAVVCFASIIVMTLCIQKEKKNRTTAFMLPIMLTVVVIIALGASNRVLV